MRVLERDPSVLYKMAKNKKHKIRKAKENEADDSSEDGILNGCPHVSKAVNLAAVRKVVLKQTFNLGECSTCSKEAPKTTSRDLFGSLIEGPAAAAVRDDMDPAEYTVCICLQCGHQGCDRNSPNKHALKHFKTPHSGLHCIIVNLTTWSTWCYMCDEEVNATGKIKACIDFLQKQAGVARPESSHVAGHPAESPVTDSPSPSTNSSKNSPSVSCVKVKGLSNLGNTCFFNAVMQSMCQTRGLDVAISERSKAGRVCSIPGLDLDPDSTESSASEEEGGEGETHAKHKSLPSIQTTLGEAGQVTSALLNFLQEMKGGTSRNGIVNPTSLFTQVCKKAPRFKGFQQQDSHELLRYLVDSVRTEEIKRGQASILKYFKLPETISPKKVDEEVKMKVKEYGRQVKHTFLDSFFGGQLVSTVKCEECKSISQIFEAFLDLSLPVMEEKPQRPNLVLIGKKKEHAVCTSVEVTPGDGGMDLDAYAERPSKYQERKNRRMAKKDTKRKAKLQKLKPAGAQQSANSSKADKEEAAEQDSDVGSDNSKMLASNSVEGVDKDDAVGSLVDDTADRTVQGGETGMSPGRSIRSVTAPQSSNTSMDSIVEGVDKLGKKGVEGGESDDPSDADVEDNLESDMGRVKSWPVAAIVSAQSPLNASGNSNLEQCGGNGSKGANSSLTADRDVSLSGKMGEGEAVNLCEKVSSELGDTAAGEDRDKLSGVDGASIVCEVSVSNSEAQVVKLANGLGCLTVHDSSTYTSRSQGTVDSCGAGVSPVGRNPVDVNGVSSPLLKEENGESVDADSGRHSQQFKKEVDDDSSLSSSAQCQVSATFTVNLPATEVCTNAGENRCDSTNGKSESVENGIDNHSSSENVDLSTHPKKSETLQHNGDLDVCVGEKSSMEATIGEHSTEKCVESGKVRQHEGGHRPEVEVSQNGIKSQQKYLKEARSLSMSTLAPRYHPSPKECSIVSCLNQFTAAELLTGSNKFGCKECTRQRRTSSDSLHGESKKSKDTVYSNASKQYLIFRPPAILTLHLKRFEQTGLTSRKVNRHVDFSLLLDLAPYCSSLSLGVKAGQSKVLYSLYAVVEHSGRLSGGHYTAYIKVRPGVTSYTQFLHTQPPARTDLLNVYLDRIVKSRENLDCALGNGVSNGLPATAADASGSSQMDPDLESRAECLPPPGRWFHVSDSRVNEVTDAVVLRAQAYLLFYERIF